MSFFSEGPEGRELSIPHCGKAVQYVLSLDLHLQGRHRDQADEHAVSLFCCIWALERLNAAFHGRPVLMHQRDLRRNLEDYIDHQQPCFQLFLRVIFLLDKVIDIYRPGLDPKEMEWRGDFPPVRRYTGALRSFQVPTSLLDESDQQPMISSTNHATSRTIRKLVLTKISARHDSKQVLKGFSRYGVFAS